MAGEGKALIAAIVVATTRVNGGNWQQGGEDACKKREGGRGEVNEFGKDGTMSYDSFLLTILYIQHLTFTVYHVIATVNFGECKSKNLKYDQIYCKTFQFFIIILRNIKI